MDLIGAFKPMTQQNKEVLIFFISITIVLLVLALANEVPGVLERL